MKKPLPSWADGGAREAIVQFVRRATNPTCTGYVPPPERIAVFDGDGTLWCERPMSALTYFLVERLHELSRSPARLSGVDPQVVCAARDGDFCLFQELNPRRVAEAMLQAHADLTASELTAHARRFMLTAVHPRFGVPFGKLAYQPMLELLAYLRGKDFRPFIVADGSAEFVRASSEELYGVPPERVAGTFAGWGVDGSTGGLRLLHTRALLADHRAGEAKVRAIHERVGRRPILAIGNSASDCEMLEYARSSTRPTLCLLLHHDDDRREYAYTPPGLASGQSLLETAASKSWHVISMRHDFRRVFAALERRLRRSAYE